MENVPEQNPAPTTRLLAWWVFSETGLAGILHAWRFPWTGVWAGGFSALVISLLGKNGTRSPELLRQTLMVLAAKIAGAPHTPPMAYLSVGFQGLVGAWLWRKTGGFLWKFRTLLALGFLQSATQRLLVLTVLFGVGFWEALGKWSKEMAMRMGMTSTSATEWIAIWIGVYLLGYVVAWFFASAVMAHFPEKLPELSQAPSPALPEKLKQRIPRWIKAGVALLVLSLLAWFAPEGKGRDWLWIFLRGWLVLLGWMVLIEPFVKKILRSWADKQLSTHASDWKAVIAFLPTLPDTLSRSWIQSKNIPGFLQRIAFFLALALSYHAEPAQE